MRALTLRFTALIVGITLMIFTPLVAAASGADPLPDIGPAMSAWHMMSAAGLGAVGLGALIQLKAKDASGAKKTFAVDTDKPTEAADTIEAYAELRAEEAAGPLQSKIERLAAENQLLRDKLAGEILRVRKLTAGEDFDLDGEKAYLMGDETKDLPPLAASRLVAEFDRLPAREEIKLKAKTSNEAPKGEENDPYAKAEA